MKSLFVCLVSVGAAIPMLAQAQGLPSFPGWRNYLTQGKAFADKFDGKYYITNGTYNLVPGVLFDTKEKADTFAEWLTWGGQQPFVSQFAPEPTSPYFSYFIGKAFHKLDGEVCTDFSAVVLSMNHETHKNYLSVPNNPDVVLAGPFETDDEGQTARRIADEFEFVRHCTYPGSNLNFFRSAPKATDSN